MPVFDPDKPMKKVAMDLPKRNVNALYFDIETEGLPDAVDGMYPSEFAAPANWKDPEKIAAKVKENMENAKKRAALSALTGRVLAIGYAMEDEPVQILEGEERDMLDQLFVVMKHTVNHGGRIFGFNIIGFDLPFMAQRAAISHATLPLALYSFYRGRFNWCDSFQDLQLRWLAGQRDFSGHNLRNLSRLLKLPIQKTGDGAAFSGLYHDKHDEAIEYLKTDVETVRALAKRLA